MASIRKRAGEWQAQVRRTGFAPAIKTFSKKTDALEWARKVETRIDRSELEPDRKILERTTLRDIIIRYRDEVVPQKRGRDDETIVLNAFLRHRICGKSLKVLGPDDFASYRDERLEEVSSATLKRQLTSVRSSLNIAIKQWRMPLRHNPLTGLQLTAVDIRRERRLREDELDRLVWATEKTRNPLIWPIIVFALETAMRRGEIVAMRWNHVDVARRSVVIPQAKNGHSRTIPLTPKAVALLEGLPGRVSWYSRSPRTQ